MPHHYELFGPHSSRIRAINVLIHGEESEYQDFIGTISAFPAPQLEYSVITFPLFARSTLHISPTLFNNNSPRMKALTLEEARWFPANRFANLTQLSIANSKPRIERFTHFLSGCTSLESIFLRDFNFDGGGYSNVTEVVTLPRLRYLSVSETNQLTTDALFSCIKLPASMVLHIHSMWCSNDTIFPSWRC